MNILLILIAIALVGFFALGLYGYISSKTVKTRRLMTTHELMMDITSGLYRLIEALRHSINHYDLSLLEVPFDSPQKKWSSSTVALYAEGGAAILSTHLFLALSEEIKDTFINQYADDLSRKPERLHILTVLFIAYGFALTVHIAGLKIGRRLSKQKMRSYIGKMPLVAEDKEIIIESAERMAEILELDCDDEGRFSKDATDKCRREMRIIFYGFSSEECNVMGRILARSIWEVIHGEEVHMYLEVAERFPESGLFIEEP